MKIGGSFRRWEFMKISWYLSDLMIEMAVELVIGQEIVPVNDLTQSFPMLILVIFLSTMNDCCRSKSEGETKGIPAA
jgi:hypothetical protein